MAHRVASAKLGLKYSTVQTFHDTVLQPGLNLGMYFEDYQGYGGQLFKLVDAAAVAGDVVYMKSYTALTVTPTIGNSSTGEVAGVITASVAANEYCWVQKRGVYSTKANGVFARGTPVWADSGNNRIIPAGVFGGSLTAATTTTVGGIVQIANPCTGAALVTFFQQSRTTKSTGAATMDLGTAVDSTTGSDNLLDGINMNAAEANFENNFQNGGTNGKPAVIWAAGGYINGTASATVAGLVGTYSGTFRPIGVKDANLQVLGIAQAAISSGKTSTLLNIPYLG